MTHEVFIQLST